LNFGPPVYGSVTSGMTLNLHDIKISHVKNGFNEHIYAIESSFKLKCGKKYSITPLMLITTLYTKREKLYPKKYKK
jgi:hypothetical protein